MMSLIVIVTLLATIGIAVNPALARNDTATNDTGTASGIENLTGGNIMGQTENESSLQEGLSQEQLGE
jgi:hypothetical protein